MAIAELELPKSSQEYYVGQEREKTEKWLRFLARLNRLDIAAKVTPRRPIIYTSMEVYDPYGWGTTGAGGLGVLAADIWYLARKLGIPFKGVTALYPKAWFQNINNSHQEIKFRDIRPEDFGYTKINPPIFLYTNNHRTPIDFYKKGDARVAFHPDLGYVYQDEKTSDHRLYQQVAALVTTMKGTLSEGYVPSVIMMNEAPGVISALAYCDWLCQNQGFDFPDAMKLTSSVSKHINHTLELSACAPFTREQYEEFILKNLSNEDLKNWIRYRIDKAGGCLSLESIAFEIASQVSGVSIMQSEIACQSLKKINGDCIECKHVTNGFFFDEWIYPDMLEAYHQYQLIDEFDLPTDTFKDRLVNIKPEDLRRRKEAGKATLRRYLPLRRDQNGRPIIIPRDSLIVTWARRLQDYKQPDLILEELVLASRTLREENIHLLIAGRLHPTDQVMAQKLPQMLQTIDRYGLADRIHFIEDYEPCLAKLLLAGSDGWLNTPIIGKEACGTSWEMAIGNFCVLISTRDGGVADVKNSRILEVTGNGRREQALSLYRNLREMAAIVRNGSHWNAQIKNQLEDYLNIMSGSRMFGDYLNLYFPKAA